MAAAAASPILAHVFGNGIYEPQLTQGVEIFNVIKDGYIAGATLKGTFMATLTSVAVDIAKPTRIELAVAGAAALADSKEFAPAQGCVIKTDRAFDDAKFDEAGFGDDDFASACKDAVAVIVSCKVNWWKGNHHTGGKVAQGFVLRLFKLFEVPTINEDVTTLVWRAAHWFDTAAWIGALGATGVASPNVAALKARIGADEATRKRIASGPAGTAAFEAVIAGLNALAAHPVVGAANSPALLDLALWGEIHKDIAENAACYHIGAQYLTGKPKREIPVVPDAVISHVATGIRYINRDATLAKAAVFSKVADDVSALNAFRQASEFKEEKRSVIGLANWFASEGSA